MPRYYTEEHEWIDVDGDVATVGITDFAQSQLGDITVVELPEPGSAVKQGDAPCVVDSVKAASIRDFEVQLRGLGYSQREAKALASGGFKSLTHRDGESDSATLADEIKTLKHLFNWSN